MIYELVYTSAPAGLRPGSSGYCTVQSSRGIPAPTVDLLESLSGYRHVYTAGTPEAANNPVNYGHYMLRVQGRQEHVLSRVSDCALDHTGRSNKLGHHMVIDNPDAIHGGPAWLLQQPGWMVNSWDGSVKLLDKARNAPATARPAAPCKTWQNVTGDAGWAGVLAETFLADPGRKVFLIYQPGVDILALFEEAIALLPATRRWDVTFSTYGAALPATVDCLWTGVITGTQEEHLSKRFVNALRIDLTKSIGAAPDTGKLVSVARTGKTAATAKISPPAERPVTTASGISMTSGDVVEDRHNLMPQAHTTQGKLTKAPPPVRRAVKKESFGNGRLILIVLACVVFFGGGTVGSMIYFLQKPDAYLVSESNSTSNEISEITSNNEPLTIEHSTSEAGTSIINDLPISTNTDHEIVSNLNIDTPDNSRELTKENKPVNTVKRDNPNDNVKKDMPLPVNIIYPSEDVYFGGINETYFQIAKSDLNGININSKVSFLLPLFNKSNEPVFSTTLINGSKSEIDFNNGSTVEYSTVSLTLSSDYAPAMTVTMYYVNSLLEKISLHTDSEPLPNIKNTLYNICIIFRSSDKNHILPLRSKIIKSNLLYSTQEKQFYLKVADGSKRAFNKGNSLPECLGEIDMDSVFIEGVPTVRLDDEKWLFTKSGSEGSPALQKNDGSTSNKGDYSKSVISPVKNISINQKDNTRIYLFEIEGRNPLEEHLKEDRDQRKREISEIIEYLEGAKERFNNSINKYNNHILVTYPPASNPKEFQKYHIGADVVTKVVHFEEGSASEENQIILACDNLKQMFEIIYNNNKFSEKIDARREEMELFIEKRLRLQQQQEFIKHYNKYEQSVRLDGLSINLSLVDVETNTKYMVPVLQIGSNASPQE